MYKYTEAPCEKQPKPTLAQLDRIAATQREIDAVAVHGLPRQPPWLPHPAAAMPEIHCATSEVQPLRSRCWGPLPPASTSSPAVRCASAYAACRQGSSAVLASSMPSSGPPSSRPILRLLLLLPGSTGPHPIAVMPAVASVERGEPITTTGETLTLGPPVQPIPAGSHQYSRGHGCPWYADEPRGL